MIAADSARYYRAHREEILIRARARYQRDKAKLAKKRKTPAFRAHRAAYMREYKRQEFS